MANMIQSIAAAQRLDSRGNPTVQVDVVTSKGRNSQILPSGASTGSHEAFELRDGDNAVYGGKGVEKAVKSVTNTIGPALIKKRFDPATQLKEIDAFMKSLDGTPNKAKLGANAILGVSMACARAGAAAAASIPGRYIIFIQREAGKSGNFVMPVPFFNVLNGGVHSGNTMAFQEFMIAPVGATSMAEAVRMGAETYHHLKKVIDQDYGPTASGLGDEGGFAPPLDRPEQALDLLVKAIEAAGHTGKIKLGVDPASSEFFVDGKYDLGLKAKTPNKLSSAEMQKIYHGLLEKYPIVLLEDPFAEDDWESWTQFCKSSDVELVGDDLLTTNVDRVKVAEQKDACNSMLLKVNQIGTVTEAIQASNMCGNLGWNVFVSHRSGETTDDFIADITVGLRTGHLKSGSPARGERVAKYNRLMDIEAELNAQGQTCTYAGARFNDISALAEMAK
ncbi:hypothetical protein G7046_g4049 [Stylonectria norvegica]|nr:hypothetical protein G7046_g4049 [Stylonectria norvegica]